MKYVTILLIFFLLTIFSFNSSAFGTKIACDYTPRCTPVMEQCGECTYRTRVTLCDGGCGEWSACDQISSYGTQPQGLTDGCYEGEYRNYYCPGNSTSATYEVILHDDPDNDGFDECSDCDQTNSAIHPNATEICDGIDNDCDGEIDEDAGLTYYADSDGDGFGDPDSFLRSCTKPSGYVIDNTDCDDTDDSVHPNATEICDGIDNNCNGLINEGLIHAGPLNTKQDGICSGSYQSCDSSVTDWYDDYSGGLLDSNYEEEEVSCDGLDNDCDGEIDEGVLITYYYDQDGDSYGREFAKTDRCAPLGFYRATKPGDCDDTVASCTTDCSTLVYYDGDNDGFGNSTVTHRACDADSTYVNLSGDCNDSNPDQYPGNQEVCDGLDNDCNGEIDEGWITFAEREDHLNSNQQGVCSGSLQQCSAGEWVDWYAVENIPSYQTSEYTQDGLDNDCDGVVDEGLFSVSEITCERDYPIPGMINCSFENPSQSTATQVMIYYSYYPDVSYAALSPDDLMFSESIPVFGEGTYPFTITNLSPDTEIQLFLFTDNMSDMSSIARTTTGGAPDFGMIVNSPLSGFSALDGTSASLRDKYGIIRSEATLTSDNFQSIIRNQMVNTILYPWIDTIQRSASYTYSTDVLTQEVIYS